MAFSRPTIAGSGVAGETCSSGNGGGKMAHPSHETWAPRGAQRFTTGGVGGAIRIRQRTIWQLKVTNASMS